MLGKPGIVNQSIVEVAMFHRLGTLIQKEIIQFTRDRILLGFSLLAPAIQIILLGRAISQDIVGMGVAVIDYDHSPLSREVITALDNTRELNVLYYPENLDEARDLIDRGEIIGLVVIPRNFMQDSQSTTVVPQIQVIVDGVSSLIAGRTVTAAQGAVQALIEDSVIVNANDHPPGGIRVFTEALFNQTLDFRPDSQTSQLGLITFQVTTLVAVMGIVREREIGTIEMLTITPLRKLELIAGKMITPLLLGTINFLLMLSVTQFIFEVELRGSFWVLFGLTVLYLFTETAYALMVSTITKSQQQATTVVFVWAMVALTLSGYLVPITTLPKTMQWISWAVPLRHYLTIERSIILKGSGFAALWPEALAILILGVAMTLITTRTLTRVTE
ncbi:MAG: ABC transporter permease [Anaerolineae bacterium]|nr:ABC transporter permease [Anaerolineae bacterium]